MPAASAARLRFIKQSGFPRRWSAIQGDTRKQLAAIVQEHTRDERGRSVFRYRALLLPDSDIGLFGTLRSAKEAITRALAA